MNSFKYNLIIARKKKELTQKQMAEKLGIAESCYAHWEQGRNEPGIDMLLELCSILEISSDYLLGLKSF
ncbi:MAG: XRE family transcriptional regulator [Clostridia bacterium]|nr:XRE family transcriptional regulator [Clostridia bacterium]